MPSSHDPKQNRILAALLAKDYARVLPDLDQLCAQPNIRRKLFVVSFAYIKA